MRHFSQFRELLPYSQNTALKRKCKVSFVLCFVLKILFEKNTHTQKKKKKKQTNKKKKQIQLVVREMIPLVIVTQLILFALFQNISY